MSRADEFKRSMLSVDEENALRAEIAQLRQQLAQPAGNVVDEKPPCDFCIHQDKGVTEAPCTSCERVSFGKYSEYEPMFKKPAFGDLLSFLRDSNKPGLARIVHEAIALLSAPVVKAEQLAAGQVPDGFKTQQMQAVSWLMVCAELETAYPDWQLLADTGQEAAVLAIRKLASDIAPWQKHAANWLDNEAQKYWEEQGGYEDMGTISFGTGRHAEIKLDWYNWLVEAADELRAMLSAAPVPGTVGQEVRP